MELRAVLLDYKQRIRERTLAVLKKVPDDKLNWKPTPEVLSVGQLIRHIGQADMAWTKVLREEWDLKKFVEARRSMDLLETLGEVESLSDELESIQITQQELLNWIASQTDAALEKEYESHRGKITAREVILGLCEHETHHRAQIVTYLRLLGVSAPRPWGF